jgi:hypothetical protein
MPMDFNIHKLFERLKDSDVVRSILAQDEQARATKHEEAFKRLDRTTRETDAAYAVKSAELTKAKAALRKVEPEWQDAAVRVARIERDIRDLGNAAFIETSYITRELVETASPLIREAVTRLEKRFESERQTITTRVRPDAKYVETDRYDIVKMRPILAAKTNAGGIAAMAQSFHAACRRLEALELQHVADLPAAIAEIEGSVSWSAAEAFTSVA